MRRRKYTKPGAVNSTGRAEGEMILGAYSSSIRPK